MMTTAPQQGFTLVETLVSITIIALALVGPFYAVQQALNASRSARDQLVATSLAQEGLEYVRSIRDGNYTLIAVSPGSRTWLAALDGTSGGTATYANCVNADCVVDPTQNTVSTSIVPLYLSATGLYNQQMQGTQTVFTRTVRLSSVSATEVRITVTVTWKTKNVDRSATVSETLHNWL